jgi:hypothetical protein
VTVPSTIGRYEIVDLIGHGSTGALYRARDPRIGRYVAIKLLSPDLDTPELRERFSREAAAAGRLNHPNIVTIYDVGESNGLPFIAMEYVRGETFSDLLNLRPPLAVPRKVQLVEEVCAGLAHAHEAGIIHRDIRPANLIVGPEGTVKILDFGIAKLSTSGMTIPRGIIGSLNYVSPEQIEGANVDTRSDIFAVGAVLYELLSHQQAFPGDVPDEVFERILHGIPTPITEYCPELDQRLVRVIERTLEKDPDRRFREAVALQKELTGIRLSLRTAEPRPTGTRRPVLTGTQTAAITPPPAPAEPDLTRRRARVDEHLDAAERALAAGNYDAAIESCKQALILDDSEERAFRQLNRIHAAIDEQQAQAARQRQEEARIRAAVDAARERFVRGEHQAALQSLEALGPGSNALVASTLEELRLTFREFEERQRIEKERVERQRRIKTLLSDGRAAVKDQRLDDAERVLELLREIDPVLPELSDLTERVGRAQALARMNAEVERILRELGDRLTQNDLPAARDLLKSAVSIAPTDSRVLGAGKRLEEAAAAQAAKEAAEARWRDGERKIDEAATCLENGDLSGAAALLTLASELAPRHPRAAELSEQLREATERRAAAEAAERLRQQVVELVRSASQRLETASDQPNELALALKEIDRALALDSGNADATTLKTTIEETIAAHREAARVRAALNNARARFAIGKYQAALSLLESFQPSTQPEIVALLSELRGGLLEMEAQRRIEQERVEKEARVAGLLEKARTALLSRQFDTALALLSSAGEIDAAAPGLSALLERARQEQAAARVKAELDKMLADVDERVAVGDLPAANQILNAATALDPPDERVQVARQRVEQAMAAREAAEARTRDLDKKHAAIEEFLDQGNLQGAVRLLKLAQDLDAQHPRTVVLSERVDDAIRKQEAADAAEHLRHTIDALLSEAAEQLQSADASAYGASVGMHASAALQTVTRALELMPDHAGAQALKTKAEGVLAGERQTALVRTAIRNARSRFANGKHQAALQLLESLDQSHPLVIEALKELRGALAQTVQNQSPAASADRPESEAEAARTSREGSDERAQTGRGRIDTADEDATRVILLPDAQSGRPRVGETELPLAVPEPDHLEDGEQTATHQALSPERIQRDQKPPRTWRWGLMGGAVLLLVVLATLFLSWRRSGSVAPTEPRSSAVRGGQIVTEPSPPSPNAQPAFAVTLTGEYPFEVVLPGGVQESAESHQFELPAGTTEVWLRNTEYFLDSPLSITGAAGEAKGVSAPPLASLTVYSWNDVCEIAIDGRPAGFHPLTLRLVTGSHLVSVLCPDGSGETKRVAVSAAQSEPLTFTKPD